MTEVTTAFDLDAWLNGAKRTERSVTVYGRPDLLAVIDTLEAEKRVVENIPAEDRAMSDGDGSHLQEQIDALYLQMGESKLDLRVTFLDDEEQKKIRDEVERDLEEEADAASRKAATEARKKCARAEIKAPNEINEVVRRMTTAAAEKVVEREIAIRTLAECIIEPVMSVSQVRALYKKLGDAQVGKITSALTQALIEAPEVQVPKSLTPSPAHDGAMSS